jgi:hypothetical protein
LRIAPDKPADLASTGLEVSCDMPERPWAVRLVAKSLGLAPVCAGGTP